MGAVVDFESNAGFYGASVSFSFRAFLKPNGSCLQASREVESK
jgi:hypothetical protein